MTTLSSVVVQGLLKQDGTLELDTPPLLPPGRVQITLQTLTEQPTREQRLPDPPLMDDCIAAPFDLPYPKPLEPIQTRPGRERLPEVWEWTEEDFR